MEIKEKIRKIYQKNKVQVDDDYIKNAMKNEQRVKSFMRQYEIEEVDSMNDIFEKEYDNKTFTKEELEFANQMDLFNPNTVIVLKAIWKSKDNPKKLDLFLKILKNEGTQEDAELSKVLQEKMVVTNVSNN